MRSMYFPLYLVSLLLFSSIVHNVKYNLWLNWERQYTQDIPLVTWKNYILTLLYHHKWHQKFGPTSAPSVLVMSVMWLRCKMLFDTIWNIVKISIIKNFYSTYYYCVFVLVEVDKPTDRSTHVGSEDNVQWLAEVFLPLLDLGSKCGLSGLHNRSFYLLSHFTTSLSMFL